MTAGPESRGAGLSRRFDAVAPGVGARQTGSSEALTLQLAQSRLEITTLKEQIAALRVQQAAAAASAAALTSRRN